MICCLVSLVFVGIVMWFLYKNKSKCINHPIVIGMSAISLIISVTTVIYLCCSDGCLGIGNINYGDTSVTVLTTIIGLLIGWNIYSVIDTKSIIKKYEILKTKTTKEISQLKEERKWLKEYVDTTRNYTIGITNLMDGKYGNAVAFLCSAAVKANKIQENKIQNDSLSHIQRTIDKHKDNMGDIAYLETFFQLIKDDFNKIEDKRVKGIVEAIEEIISKNKNGTQDRN